MKTFEFSFKIALKFVPDGLINNIPTLIQLMACRRPGDKSLSETMMIGLAIHLMQNIHVVVFKYSGQSFPTKNSKCCEFFFYIIDMSGLSYKFIILSVNLNQILFSIGFLIK